MIDTVRRRLIALGFQLLRKRGIAQASGPTEGSTARSTAFDDLTSAEVRQLSSEDIAMLARIRRSIARIDSDLYGDCRACGASIGSDHLYAMPEVDICPDCAHGARRIVATIRRVRHHRPHAGERPSQLATSTPSGPVALTN